MKSWRDKSRPIIANVLAVTKGQSETSIQNALFDAYPFGKRLNHPYKVWLDEIKKQRHHGLPVDTSPMALFKE